MSLSYTAAAVTTATTASAAAPLLVRAGVTLCTTWRHSSWVPGSAPGMALRDGRVQQHKISQVRNNKTTLGMALGRPTHDDVVTQIPSVGYGCMGQGGKLCHLCFNTSPPMSCYSLWHHALPQRHTVLLLNLKYFLMQTLHLAIVILCQINHYVYLHHSILELMGKYIYTYTVNTCSLGPKGDITVRFFWNSTNLLKTKKVQFNANAFWLANTLPVAICDVLSYK